MTSSQPTHNQLEYSVSEISSALKRVVEDNFGYVRVRGEISGLKAAASGHVYLALKDDKSVLDGVMWRGNAAQLNFRPEDGLEVIASGKISTYGGRSKYQIIIDRMEPAGIGALMALLEKRKQQLTAEGLFDPARKKAKPYLPEVIGVITSPTGAVIRDILHRLADRFPRRVLLWPVLVQGEGAAEQIAAAIKGFNSLPASCEMQEHFAEANTKKTKSGDFSSPERASCEMQEHFAEANITRPNLLIVARGGGSLEDLWAFNEEIVVRAAAESEIPLISAVGHETDTTLIDYAADLRAPTPTAAAELAVPRRADCLAALDDHTHRIRQAMHQSLHRKEERISGLARGLPRPMDLLQQATQRLDDRTEQLARSLPSLLRRKEEMLTHLTARLRPQLMQRELEQQFKVVTRLSTQLGRALSSRLSEWERVLSTAGKLLNSLNYQQVLRRGFALVRGKDGTLRTSASAVHRGESLSLTFHDGEVAVTSGTKQKQGELF